MSAPRIAGRMRRGRLAAIMLAVAFCFSAREKALADDLTVLTKGSQSFEVDDNPLLLTAGAKRSYGSITSPEVTVYEDTPALHLSLDSRIDVNEYNLPHFSSTDSHTQYKSNYTGQTFQLGFDGGYDYDTTRTSELTSTGLNTAGIRHSAITLSPHGQLNLTQLDQAVISASYYQSNYINTQLYTSYHYITVYPGFQHSFDPNDTGTIGLQASKFDTEVGQQDDVYTVGPQFGWEHNFSQRLNLTASVGAIRSEGLVAVRTPGIGSISYDYTYNLDLEFTGQQDTIHLTSSRAPSPGSNGTESLLESFGLTEKHFVTSRVELDLSLQYQISSYGQRTPFAQQDYIDAEPSIAYHLTEAWQISSEYRYRRQDQVGVGVPGESSAVLVHLIYTPQTLALGL